MKPLLLAGFFIFGSSILGIAGNPHGEESLEHHKEGEDDHGHEEKEFNVGEMIMHHIADANEFHVVGDFSVPLPVIIYNRSKGDWFFSFSNKFEAHHGNGTKEVGGYVMHHSRVYPSKNVENEHEIEHIELHIADLNKKLGSAEKEGNQAEVEAIHHEIEEEEAKLASLSDNYIDFSITKNVFTIFLVVILMLIIFRAVAKGYKNRPGKAPKGIQSLLEPVIIFVRDEIAIPSIGKHKYEKFTPFLLTLFFFIWIGNIIGLIPFFPGSANLTGNIAVPIVLALFTFVIYMVNGNKHFWKHILAMPGIPKPVLIILTPIEIFSAFVIKPATLIIRLFANITAGHIVLLVFVSLIFIFGQNSAGAGFGAAVPALFFTIFLNVLELLVGAIQAYVFTLLSAIYIGMAVAEEHH